MSEWYEPNNEDIDLDVKAQEVNIYVKQNDQGSVNVALSFTQIKELYKQIQNLNT